jgi:ATP-binding cassette subfamily F protein 3
VDSPFHFRFRAPLKAPDPLLQLDRCSAGYGERTVLSGVNLTLGQGDRVGLLGPNGAGKSTLIKFIAGELVAQSGKRAPAKDTLVGYFAQHQVEQLVPAQSPLEHLQLLDSKAREQELRNFLGGFGFIGDQALAPTGPFSGGEKSRLVLAMVVYQRPNLLLLDEPTNHLDLEMRQALATALQDFQGAMVLVSHDRHLLRVSCDQLLLVHGGEVKEFEGSLDDYPQWLMDRDKSDEALMHKPDGAHTASARKDRKRQEAEWRRTLDPLRKSVLEAESNMDALHRQQQALQRQLAEPDIYEIENKESLKRLLNEKAELDKACSEAEELWMERSEKLELTRSELLGQG